jgi:zinc/manganese transport system permease protein
MPGDPGFSWNPLTDLQQLWAYPFMVNAFRAGAIVAVVAGAVGWFMVLRRQTFAGHSLSVISFPGASGAVLVGVSPAFGYYAFCLAGALVIALAMGNGTRGAGRLAHESALIGVVQSFALGLGLLFASLTSSFLEGTTSTLFGTFLGISDDQVLALAAVGVAVLTLLATIARPLLFASVDPDVARARGINVRALSVAFLLLLAVAVAEAAQITGALLVFALLVMPAATAQRLTARPLPSLLLTIAIGWLATWAGLVVGYYTPYPVGFTITSFTFAAYLLAHVPTLTRVRTATDKMRTVTARA